MAQDKTKNHVKIIILTSVAVRFVCNGHSSVVNFVNCTQTCSATSPLTLQDSFVESSIDV